MHLKSFILDRQEFEKQKVVNKFMPLERALNLLNSKTFWFANPEEWNDPFEKRFINATYGSNQKFAWKGHVFCTCFTNNATSEASWNAYSKNEPCIKFSFDRKELLQFLDDIQLNNNSWKVYFDRVEYMRTAFIKKPLPKIPFDPEPKMRNLHSIELKERLLLLKRKAFEYEQEYRAIIIKPKITKERGISVPIPNHGKLIKEVTIGPTVRDDTCKMLKELFQNKYNFNPSQIKKSLLYESIPEGIKIKI